MFAIREQIGPPSVGSMAPNCMLTGSLASDADVLPLTTRIHKQPLQRTGKPRPVQHVPPLPLAQLPPPPLRTVSHKGYNLPFSSSVRRPPLSPHTVFAAPARPSPDVKGQPALPKAVLRVRGDSREQLDLHTVEHSEAAALFSSRCGSAQNRNRFSISRAPAKAHQHGRRSQRQSTVGPEQAEVPVNATLAHKAVAELWQVEARWRSLGLPEQLTTTELMYELKANPPLPGTSPLGAKGAMTAEVAKSQGKLHGFLPKATRELPMKDYLAKRSSQWSTLRSRRRSIAAGGLTMMSEVESADMMKKRDTLAQMPLLAGMSEESMESLLPLIETIDIDTEGHELIRKGVVPTHFFILVSAHTVCP